jgi:hypothetical protein
VGLYPFTLAPDGYGGHFLTANKGWSANLVWSGLTTRRKVTEYYKMLYRASAGTCEDSFGFRKTPRISRLSERLLAYQQGLCPMVLVILPNTSLDSYPELKYRFYLVILFITRAMPCVSVCVWLEQDSETEKRRGDRNHRKSRIANCFEMNS